MFVVQLFIPKWKEKLARFVVFKTKSDFKSIVGDTALDYGLQVR